MFRFLSISALLLLTNTRTAAHQKPYFKPTKNYIFPSTSIDGIARIDTKIGNQALDRPYITRHNSSSYEWWYFDAISSDGQSSIVITSFVSPLDTYENQSGLQLLVQIVSPQGGLYDDTIEYDKDEKLYISTKGDTSNGILNNGDFSWIGKSDLSEYTLNLNLPKYNISGTINLFSLAKPFVGCGPAQKDANTSIFWFFNWINVIGDAVAVVDIAVGDQKVAFTGNGYHDKNWGPVSFIPYVHHWYWGHGRVGEYSVVWSKMFLNDNTTKAGGWISKNDKIILSACFENDDSVVIKPLGNNITDPPKKANNTHNIQGFDITINTGNEQGIFQFQLKKNIRINGELGTYARWIGNFTGGQLGEEDSQIGVAVTEQMGPFVF
ncbi:uncharacterized protein L201_000325 [Kwoniella dendrophila CBS 6074]|uniref:AttH domain-containing protein n=1 Tax=Kwoniella dendrophila CBS 6074 TaxID=1295534 RepID=A0AAX4JJ45_9TREE